MYKLQRFRLSFRMQYVLERPPVKLRPPQSIRFLCKICTCLGSPCFVVTNVERSHAARQDLYLKFVRFIPGANFSIISLIYKISEGMEQSRFPESFTLFGGFSTMN